jgi:hypothetical protein
MILQLQTLIDKDACPDQCDLFRKKFGSSVDVTPELCESVASLFHFSWAAEHLLSAQALADYIRIGAPAWADYERIKAPALADYERIKASALADYQRITARTFGELYCREFQS